MKKRECYIVQECDTLQRIAEEFCGDAQHWRILWAINRSHLRGKTPDEIHPGEIIVLPPKCDLLIKKNVPMVSPTPWRLLSDGSGIYLLSDTGNVVAGFAGPRDQAEVNALHVLSALALQVAAKAV